MSPLQSFRDLRIDDIHVSRRYGVEAFRKMLWPIRRAKAVRVIEKLGGSRVLVTYLLQRTNMGPPARFVKRPIPDIVPPFNTSRNMLTFTQMGCREAAAKKWQVG